MASIEHLPHGGFEPAIPRCKPEILIDPFQFHLARKII
jgi:hypothetical protein